MIAATECTSNHPKSLKPLKDFNRPHASANILSAALCVGSDSLSGIRGQAEAALHVSRTSAHLVRLQRGLLACIDWILITSQKGILFGWAQVIRLPPTCKWQNCLHAIGFLPGPLRVPRLALMA